MVVGYHDTPGADSLHILVDANQPEKLGSLLLTGATASIMHSPGHTAKVPSPQLQLSPLPPAPRAGRE